MECVIYQTYKGNEYIITHNVSLGYIGVDMPSKEIIFCQGDDYTELFEKQAHGDIVEFLTMLDDSGVLLDAGVL